MGNVTSTTVNGLQPDTQYDFAVAAMAENQVRRGRAKWSRGLQVRYAPQYPRSLTSLNPNPLHVLPLLVQTDVEWQQLDLYGRRPMVHNALVGPFSTPTNVTATLAFDFQFAVRS